MMEKSETNEVISNAPSRDGMQQHDAFHKPPKQVPLWDTCQKPLDSADGNGSPAVCLSQRELLL